MKFSILKNSLNFYIGNESGKWYLDLKNGAGSCGKGEAATDADCTFKMKDEHFQQMFTGI